MNQVSITKPSILAYTLATLLAVSSVGAAQKPVQQNVTSVSYASPPPTLAGLYADSQTIVVVRVVGEQPVESVLGIATDLTGRIDEIVKPDSQVGPVGATITFRVPGGDIDRGDHIERTVVPGERKLLAGHEYMVALKWNPGENAFRSAYGPGTIFEVSDGLGRPQSDTELGRAVKEMALRRVILQMKSGADPK